MKILQEHVHRRRQLNGGGESLEQSDPYAVELFRYWAQAMSAALEAGQLDRAYANMLEAFTLSHQEIEKKNREFLLGHGELAKFVMNSAKVHWCRRDERGEWVLRGLLELFKLFCLFFRCTSIAQNTIGSKLFPN